MNELLAMVLISAILYHGILISPVILGDEAVVMPQQESHGSRGAVELVDLQPLHSLPVPAGVRVVRGALEEEGGAAVHQRGVDDVRVACN